MPKYVIYEDYDTKEIRCRDYTGTAQTIPKGGQIIAARSGHFAAERFKVLRLAEQGRRLILDEDAPELQRATKRRSNHE